MKCRHPWAGLALNCLLLAVGGTVALGQGTEISIRETYWQTLPDVADVHVDTHGDPWFSVSWLEPGEVRRETRLLSSNLNVHLFDQRDRIWADFTTDEQPSRRTTGYYDGTIWHDCDVVAVKVFEDTKGRVFLFDRTHVHLLDTANQWSKQEMCPANTDVTGHFVEDDEGRVWFWGETYRHQPETIGTPGLWRFDNGDWTRFDTSSGLTFDEIKHFVPLSDGRFLVVGAALENHNKYFVWSPSRTLTEGDNKVFGNLSELSVAHYKGVDVDGAHWFQINFWPQRVGDAPAYPGPYGSYGYGVWCYIPREGEFRLLTDAERSRFQYVPCQADKHFRPVLGRLTDPCAAAPTHTRSAYRDREGRIYFFLQSGRQDGAVGILWPRHAAAGEVIRNQDFGSAVTASFQTEDGTVWGLTSAPLDSRPHPLVTPNDARPYELALVRWNGNAWEETPVKSPPHPFSQSRAGPPWGEWSHAPLVFHAGNTVLYVQVRDIYQQMLSEADGEELSDREIYQRFSTQSGRERQTHWLEAWLFHDGQWSGPMRLKDCLQQHRDLLARLLARGQREADNFALVGDGAERLWAAYEGNVVAIDADGMKLWPIPMVAPSEEGEAPRPLPKLQQDPTSPYPPMYDWDTQRAKYDTRSQLLNLGDGRVLLTYSNEKIGGLLTLRMAEGKIVAEPLPVPKLQRHRGLSGVSLVPDAFVGQDGSIWLMYLYGIQQQRDGKWHVDSELGRLAFEDTDGSLWFRERASSEPENFQLLNSSFVIVKDGNSRTMTMPLPSGYSPTALTPTIDGRILCVNDYGIVELGPLPPGGERPIVRTRYFDSTVQVQVANRPYGSFGCYPAFESPDSSIFVGKFRGK